MFHKPVDIRCHIAYEKIHLSKCYQPVSLIHFVDLLSSKFTMELKVCVEQRTIVCKMGASFDPVDATLIIWLL